VLTCNREIQDKSRVLASLAAAEDSWDGATQKEGSRVVAEKMELHYLFFHTLRGGNEVLQAPCTTP
jgi:hypothetical protein